MHKDAYFTTSTIIPTSKRMLAELMEHRRRHPPSSFRPKESALLVLDAHNQFFNIKSHAYIPSSSVILPNIIRLGNLFASHDRMVVFSRHLNNPDNAGRMASWWKDLITANSYAGELVSDLNTSLGIILEKSQYDAFFTVDGTATYNQAFHMASLLNLAHGVAVPVLVEEITAAFRSGNGD